MPSVGFAVCTTGYNTGGQYDPVGNSWSATTTTGAPSARSVPVSAWTGTKMVVWGGYSGGAVNTGGQYDPTGNSWSATTTTGAPAARYHHSGVWSGSKLIAWGGCSGTCSSGLNTGGQYDPAGNSWSATTTTNAPQGRIYHLGMWSGSRMLVWGGRMPTDDLNTGGQYDPTGNSWVATSTVNAPSRREFSSAAAYTNVFGNAEMLVWGGGYAPTNTFLGDGGIYFP